MRDKLRIFATAEVCDGGSTGCTTAACTTMLLPRMQNAECAAAVLKQKFCYGAGGRAKGGRVNGGRVH